jgi:hypothetical protein
MSRCGRMIPMPRDPQRIPKILEALKEYWTKYPDLRLGQIVVNLTRSDTSPSGHDPFYVEDEELLAKLNKLNAADKVKILFFTALGFKPEVITKEREENEEKRRD